MCQVGPTWSSPANREALAGSRQDDGQPSATSDSTQREDEGHEVGPHGEDDDRARVDTQHRTGERETYADGVGAADATDPADLEGVDGGPDE